MKKSIALWVILLIVLGACRKDKIDRKLSRQMALVSTETAFAISASGFTIEGKVEMGKAGTILERGFCWSNEANPDINSFVIGSGSGEGKFLANLTGLTAGAEYWVRAFAKNNYGIWYGEIKNIQTSSGNVPNIRTLQANQEGPLQIRLLAELTNDGNYPNTIRGICFSQSDIPDTNSYLLYCGQGIGNFDTLITLSTKGYWYFRTFAINSVGISYGDVRKIWVHNSPNPSIPEVMTNPTTVIYATSLGISGTILYDGGLPIFNTGFCYSISPSPDLQSWNHLVIHPALSNFGLLITDLNRDTNYYIRAYATNALGTGYGNQISVTTDL